MASGWIISNFIIKLFLLHASIFLSRRLGFLIYSALAPLVKVLLFLHVGSYEYEGIIILQLFLAFYPE